MIESLDTVTATHNFQVYQKKTLTLMLSTEVACYTWCTPASLSIHQLHYLHATLSVVNVRICKQPEAFSQHSVVAKRCRVTHYGYTTSIPPWLHYITLDVCFFLCGTGYFEVYTQDAAP